jgi:glycosyltransferase involved in cell wall biosynthesis
LAHGLPIASTLASAGGETDPGLFPMLRDGESALLVPHEDPVRLAAAVERVMTDPELRVRLSQAAASLSKQFEWDAIAKRHLETYRGLEVA